MRLASAGGAPSRVAREHIFMTIREHLQELLELSRKEYGEDAFSTQSLKRQLERTKENQPSTTFLIGSKPGTNEK